MRVLQINTTDTRGGAAKVAYRLKHGLIDCGHQADMIVARKYSQDSGVHLLRPYSHLRERIVRKLTYLLADDLDFSPAGRIRAMASYRQADIIHLHNIHSNYFNLGTLSSITREKPTIWTLHDMWPLTAHCAYAMEGPVSNGFFQCQDLNAYPAIAWHNEKYLEWRKRNIYCRSNFHIVVPSQWLLGKVKQTVLSAKPASVIYNGIDTEVFRPQSQKKMRHELNLPEDKFIILFASKGGHDQKRKGYDYVQSISRLLGNNPNILLLIVGGDETINTPNLKRVSYISDEALLAKYFAAADIFLFPSTADNCPLVVLEVEACGLPVVSFATGGIPELVDHRKTGYI
ncbi:MAG: glycosyltransferase, partial [Candidatus Yanofskybacteria bacterium]|nr:glycosyltransferase [Candidatus Yanofskybacteria bacterium]